jgi:DNA modification methylase
METNKVYNEPCLETLRKMPNEFLDCVITSPPYWQLRDYGYEGQWGLEPTFQEYLEHLWEMMDEIYRVLKPSGTVWINLGDTFGGGNSGQGGDCGKHTEDNPNIKGTRFDKGVKKPLNKCLLLIPHRFAIGCIDRGWIVRNDIIWAKRNGMPESVTDRFSKKHEYFFFMVKSQNYYFDLDSVRDKVKEASLKRYEYDFSGNKGGADRDMIGYVDGNKKHLLGQNNTGKYGDIFTETLHRQGMNKDRGNNIVEKRPNLPNQKEFVEFIRNRTDINALVSSVNIPKTKIEHWFRKDEAGFSYPSIDDWNTIKVFLDTSCDEFQDMDKKMTYIEYETDDINKNAHKGKNCGDVADFWDVEKPKPQYAVLDAEFRNPIVEVRDLPDHNELREYLSNARKSKAITIQQIEDIFQSQAPHHWFEKNGSYPSVEDWIKLKEILEFDDAYDDKMTNVELKSGLKQNNPKGKNCGDVSDFWDIPTKPSSNSHYATYNDELLKKPVLAGCPENGLIYDPFMGTGTTAMVALRSNRNFIGSEMSAEYTKIFNRNVSPLINQQKLF